jgi:ketosteroid isomerase-like protein
VSDETTDETRRVIDRFYASYTGADLDGMLAAMAEDAVVTFLGHGTFRGIGEIRPYMTWAGTQLPKLDFRVRRKIIDGQHAAVVWDETGVTKRGEPWESQGVDVYRIDSGRIVELTVFSDTEKMLRQLEPYPGAAAHES